MRSRYYLPVLLFMASAIGTQQVQAQVITTFAGTGSAGYSGDSGLSYHAKLNGCTGMAVDGAGNVYIADKNNNVVRKVSTAGIITTFAGTGAAGYSGNGGQATLAKLNKPYSAATDAAGNVYIADNNNNVVRVVSASGIISTYAGNDTAGYNGDGIPASHASLCGPQGIAFDAVGNLYIADAGNNRVRKVNAAGVITTVAGTGSSGYTGDNGLATSAQLSAPSAVAIDAAGDVYIADILNNVVRKIDGSTRIITTVAGNNTPGFGGDGGAATSAQLHYPAGVSLDEGGNLYIADQGNNTIREVDGAGNISVFAGKHTSGYGGDYGVPTDAELSAPVSVYVDGWGRVYIADYANNAVRIITAFALGTPSVVASTGMKVYPNPTTGSCTIELPATMANATVTVTDVLGNTVATCTATGHTTAVNLSTLPAGTYTVKAVSAGKSYTQQIEVAR